jgi:hypothetical protein
MFPEWRSIEPAQGAWKWDSLDATLKSAPAHHLQIEAILMGSTPWTKDGSHSFPMNNLADWSNYVFTSVNHCQDRVRFWEVWNEGNGAFNDRHNTTADYASLVSAAYAAAKKADPKAQVGMTVASFDAPYLDQAILAQAREGHPNTFDYLCIHPYEVADGLANANGEIPYLWMVHSLRQILAAHAPERRDADIWITEVGRRIESGKGISTTDADAARALVKIYTMALAQGIKRTLWFEARDPVGEDQGFGLLNRVGAPRKAYDSMKTMTGCLGATPFYKGWLALGAAGAGYGFVFQGASADVLAAWMPAGKTDGTTIFTSDVQVMDPVTGGVSTLKASQSLTMTDAPVFVVGVPADLAAEAQSNAGKNFPWGGDYSKATAVSLQFGAVTENRGVFQLSRKAPSIYHFPDGTAGAQMLDNHSAKFYAHPSFGSLLTNDYYIRLTVRRIGSGNVGMNLFYEVADSKGQAAYRNKGEWFGLSEDTGWQTHIWHVTDACFSRMWGYDFSFRPEKSGPFVIGKVEVNKAPF